MGMRDFVPLEGTQKEGTNGKYVFFLETQDQLQNKIKNHLKS